MYIQAGILYLWRTHTLYVPNIIHKKENILSISCCKNTLIYFLKCRPGNKDLRPLKLYSLLVSFFYWIAFKQQNSFLSVSHCSICVIPLKFLIYIGNMQLLKLICQSVLFSFFFWVPSSLFAGVFISSASFILQERKKFFFFYPSMFLAHIPTPYLCKNRLTGQK